MREFVPSLKGQDPTSNEPVLDENERVRGSTERMAHKKEWVTGEKELVPHLEVTSPDQNAIPQPLKRSRDRRNLSN